MRSLARYRSLVVLASFALLGCSSDDKATNPDGGGGGGGANPGVTQFGAQIGGIATQYFVGNAEGYASAGAMLPYIAASLATPAPPAPAHAFAPALSCFAGVAGTTYIFNGSAYVAGPATGAPTNGVRYVIYRLDGANQPVLADSIGYVEVTCTVASATSNYVGVALVANGAAVFGATGVANDNTTYGGYNCTGWLGAAGAPNISMSLFCEFNPAYLQYTTDFSNGDLQVEFATVDSVATGGRTLGFGALYSPSPNWNVIVNIRGDTATETVSEGAVYYGDLNTGGLEQLVACVSGGTMTQPVFSAPSASCDIIGYGVGPAASSADLATIAAGVQQVRMIHDLIVEVADEAFGVPPSMTP